MKLLCIDFSNLVIRHAANPYSRATDQLGRSMAGPVGALRQVLRLIREEQPTHVLIARDGRRADNFRRDICADYKATRDAADEDIVRQFEAAYQAVAQLGLPCVQFERYEADDVIASACRRFPGRSVVVSGDKDLLALIDERTQVLLLRPGGDIRAGAQACEQLTGVRPERLRDLKAMEGDSSDNVCGIPGIGKKTALRLLAAHGSLAGIYAALDASEDGRLDGFFAHITTKLAAGREQARVAWRLVGMVEHLPVDCAALAVPDDLSAATHGPVLEQLGLADLTSALR